MFGLLISSNIKGFSTTTLSYVTRLTINTVSASVSTAFADTYLLYPTSAGSMTNTISTSATVAINTTTTYYLVIKSDAPYTPVAGYFMATRIT